MAEVTVKVSMAVNAVLLTVWKVVAGKYTVVLLKAVTVETPGHEAAMTPDAPKRARRERANMATNDTVDTLQGKRKKKAFLTKRQRFYIVTRNIKQYPWHGSAARAVALHYRTQTKFTSDLLKA